ncbi:hypothetical protein BUALT_Bualt09G0061400 [Buddleja alternifolia]|uniref:cysteine dioxygenase n=1 Tax=Buddleja alternifolia TaxID=168488 RepID=A0AAV6XB69_9LAMI|nr:hypothetical protein BUALT_Bualt09G0061400 [Buddleja alternifolia]
MLSCYSAVGTVPSSRAKPTAAPSSTLGPTTRKRAALILRDPPVPRIFGSSSIDENPQVTSTTATSIPLAPLDSIREGAAIDTTTIPSVPADLIQEEGDHVVAIAAINSSVAPFSEAADFEIKRSDKVGGVNKVIKKRCRRKVRIQLKRPVQVVSRTLQKLFDCCQQVFKGPGTVPCPADVQKMSHILDGMKPEDVGLSKDLQFFKPKSEVEGTPRVTSATIYKCENFELCIFFLPATAVIPLHNHPEMTVFSKLLLGTMHIKAYDWVDPLDSHHLMISPSKLRLAKMKANRMFTAPCDTSVLYPTSGGNIHEFTAITPCAVLDVIGPPYSKDDGRDCSAFYKDTQCNTLSDREEFRKVKDDECCYGWLEEIEIPKESEMDGIEYMGPQIINPTS